jgi:hypothetical protein
MAKDIKEFIKEALKAEIELLKLFSLFLIGLVSGVASMALSATYNKGVLSLVIFIVGIVALLLDWILFLIFARRIYKRLNQLKNEKL